MFYNIDPNPTLIDITLLYALRVHATTWLLHGSYVRIPLVVLCSNERTHYECAVRAYCLLYYCAFIPPIDVHCETLFYITYNTLFLRKPSMYIFKPNYHYLFKKNSYP